MLNDHDAGFSKKLLGVVIDKLSVDKDVGFMGKNFLDLLLHLGFFGFFDFTNLLERVNLYFATHDFDFVVVHWSVSYHNSWVF